MSSSSQQTTFDELFTGHGMDMTEVNLVGLNQNYIRYVIVLECSICGEEYRANGMKGHWWAEHDDVSPRPWWGPKEEARRQGPRYKWARRKAFERDDSTCQRCGSHEDDVDQLEAHHIIPFVEFDVPGEAHTVDNLLALCRECHRSVEGLSPEELETVLQQQGVRSELP